MIRIYKSEDYPALCAIYNHYVLHTNVNFDIEPLNVEDMTQKVNHSFLWLVYEICGEVIGFATATEWKAKSAYKQTAETSIYIHPGHQKKGYGIHLLCELIDLVKENKIHSLIAGIIMPNSASVKLHEKAGFLKVAHLSEVGMKNGNWHDVTYWQLVLR